MRHLNRIYDRKAITNKMVWRAELWRDNFDSIEEVAYVFNFNSVSFCCIVLIPQTGAIVEQTQVENDQTLFQSNIKTENNMQDFMRKVGRLVKGSGGRKPRRLGIA